MEIRKKYTQVLFSCGLNLPCHISKLCGGLHFLIFVESFNLTQIMLSWSLTAGIGFMLSTSVGLLINRSSKISMPLMEKRAICSRPWFSTLLSRLEQNLSQS